MTKINQNCVFYFVRQCVHHAVSIWQTVAGFDVTMFCVTNCLTCFIVVLFELSCCLGFMPEGNVLPTWFSATSDGPATSDGSQRPSTPSDDQRQPATVPATEPNCLHLQGKPHHDPYMMRCRCDFNPFAAARRPRNCCESVGMTWRISIPQDPELS